MPAQLSFDWDEVERARYDPVLLFEAPTAHHLSRLPEGQHYDRKRAAIEPRALAETICALANGDARGGVVAVGVADGEIEGFASVGEAKLNRLLQAPSQFCPLASVRIKTVQLDNNTIALFRVEYSASRVVEMTDGTVYVRTGDSNRKLGVAETAHLRMDRGELPFETELVQDAGLNDLDPEALRSFVDAVRIQAELKHDRSPEDVLHQRHLGRFDASRFIPNNACILLLAKDPVRWFPGCKVRLIRYEGTRERTGAELNVIKDQLIEGSVPVLIDQANRALAAQLREYQFLQPNGQFTIVPEYPHDCVYEAVVNACVHRSYAMRSANVFIRMFDDRLEIESPGGFVAPVTPETVYDFHLPRNPFLMDALRYMRLVRCANEGTRRMRHLLSEMGLPAPGFSQVASPSAKVTVTLRNSIEQRRVWIDRDLSALVGAQLADSLSPEEKRVLNYLAEHGAITVSDAWRITTFKTWHAARSVMDTLLQKKLVEEVKTKVRDPNAHFVLAAWLRPPTEGAGSN